MNFVISTHHKAGTHWSKYFIANYLCLLQTDGLGERVDFNGVETEYFPLRIDRLFPAHLDGFTLPAVPKNFEIEAYWSHFSKKHISFYERFDKVWFQSRNILDFLVSKFHYDMVRINTQREKNNRPSITSPFELHPQVTDNWISIVESFDLLQADKSYRYMHVVYEELRRDSIVAFSRVLKHLGLPIDLELLELAIARSSIDNTRSDEKFKKQTVVGLTYYRDEVTGSIKSSSFARSGEVGQFSKYFTFEEIELISRYVKDRLSPNLVERYSVL